MTFEQLYLCYPDDTNEGADARALLCQTHWFTSIAEFDPRTGEALPQALSLVLQKIAAPDVTEKLKDRLWRITEHVRPSMVKLFREINEAPCRENAVMPLRNVRELDATSFMALSRRPGRNIREKLAAKPYLMAVRHYQTVDLPENRLLKACAERLCELLELRVQCLGEKPDDLIMQIHSWLASDEVKRIHRWDNLPPNNTLLSHRHYRAVYDAWCKIRSLDDIITEDRKNLLLREKTMKQWIQYGQMYSAAQHSFAEMPVLFDYDRFEIFPWAGEVLTAPIPHSRVRTPATGVENAPICIDLSGIHPVYASLDDTQESKHSDRKTLLDLFMWQCWEKPDDSSTAVDINLFNADVLYLHPDSVTISSADLFFSREHRFEHLDRAARVFFSRLHETFVNENIVWLLPDFLNDFELAITRRNINTIYPGAQPLPRSVAAVLEKIKYNQLSNGFSVVVLDNIGGINCAIKLEAKFDDDLKKCLPETRGFYWERHPSVILSKIDNDVSAEMRFEYGITTLDEHGKWLPPAEMQKCCDISEYQLRRNKRIGQFNTLIRLSDSPVIGGIRLYELQKRAGDIPLWSDEIPELSIKVWNQGRYERYHLVTRGTTVKTIRGRAIKIPVKRSFTLPAGKDRYQFPLFIGDEEETIGFSARLESPDFPLKAPLECALNLTFTYGEDDSYCLVFEPMESICRPIRVKWIKSEEEIITDAPAPEYPSLISWQELQAFPNRDNAGTRDLLDWAKSVAEKIDRRLYFSNKRTTGIILDSWRSDKNEHHYTRAKCNSDNLIIRIQENNFVEGLNFKTFKKGQRISFVLKVKTVNQSRSSGAIIADWETDHNGYLYTQVRSDDGAVFRIYGSNFIDGMNPGNFRLGDRISFLLDVKENDRERSSGVIISDWGTDHNERIYTLVRNDDGAVFRIYQDNFVDGVNPTNFRRRKRVSFVLNVKDNDRERSSGEIIADWETDNNGYLYTQVRGDNGAVFRIYGSNFVDGMTPEVFRPGDRVSFVLNVKDRERSSGMIIFDWRKDKNGYLFTTAQRDDGEKVSIYATNFVSGINYADFGRGDIISFELKERNGWLSGAKIAGEDYEDKIYSASRIAAEDYEDKIYLASRIAGEDFTDEKKLKTIEDDESIQTVCNSIHNLFFFPFMQIWNDGRSLSDKECPAIFRKHMAEGLQYLTSLWYVEGIPGRIKNEIMKCIALTHKDATDECIHWLGNLIANRRIFEKRSLAYALGDVGESWQKKLFDQLVNCQNDDALRVFAYAIWREQNFVDKFTAEQIQSVLDRLNKMLANIQPSYSQQRTNDKPMVRNWFRDTAEPLELLLGLLRTRASSSAEIRMLLQPHQKITKELLKQVDRIIDIFAKSPRLFLFSRVQLGQLPAKPEGDHTPDLLYALRLYLTGDDGANAIQITGVADDDAD